ncbi:hypothetical protein CH263_06430 [Rhodococcus sp. 06-1059B-a]|nr:hypothetical protein CH263_06430 [Rhodococcus sp. 06-1059B-a]
MFAGWPVAFQPPTRRVVDPPVPVLVDVSRAFGHQFSADASALPLKVRAEGLATDLKVQGVLHAWARTSKGEWLCCLSFRVPTGNGMGFLDVERQWSASDAAKPLG